MDYLSLPRLGRVKRPNASGKWAGYPNLRRRPPRPAEMRGRLQQGHSARLYRLGCVRAVNDGTGGLGLRPQPARLVGR
jgi:hypothetical protein